MYLLRTVLLLTLFMLDYKSVLLLALFVYAYRFMRQETSTVPQTYDVFLSFRGADTRAGFTDVLYNGLVNAGLHVFRDDDALRVGEHIEPELRQAIRNCKIAIPIISENYVKSTWCLRELAQIMSCRNEHKKLVFPVFYKVDFRQLDGPSGVFAVDLSEHQATCSDKVPEWAKALTSIGCIRGWTSKTIANGHDGELAKIVTERVLSEMTTMWIERIPIFPILMSNYHIRTAYGYFSDKKRGEVFLAFHGPGTRLGFAACLYRSLVDAGVRVLKDDDPYLIGTERENGIFNAIDRCKISIPILSADYASSHRCLNDLAHMVDCKIRKGQKILPIFYKVRPSHVKNISQSFEKHMLEHKELVSPGLYAKWEGALKAVGSSGGWVSKKFANGDEGKLVKKVVERVLELLTNPQKHGP